MAQKNFFRLTVYERTEHRTTLKMLAEILEKLRVRGANGMWATRFCSLCQRLSPRQQAECVHVRVQAHVQRELARLERPLRLHEPTPESYADQTGAK